MDAKLTIADKLGRGLTNGIFFVTRKWKEQQPSLHTRSWGGFDERPRTEKCYRQERTAMILSLLFGTLGVDQFYAHHWPLAVFKLLTVGGLGVWAFVDMILWIVGGVYGTPGCPGGSSKGWQY
ncbi:hypothetical protein ACJA88_000172 [Fusarium oxysporum]